MSCERKVSHCAVSVNDVSVMWVWRASVRCECEGRQCDVNVTGVNVTIHNYDLYTQTTLILTSQCRLLQAQDATLTHLQAPYTHTTVTNKHIQLFLILYTSTDIDADASKGKSWPGYSWQQSGLMFKMWDTGFITTPCHCYLSVIMPNLHVVIPMESDGIWPSKFHWRMWAAPKNYLTRIDWMLGQVLVSVELY